MRLFGHRRPPFVPTKGDKNSPGDMSSVMPALDQAVQQPQELTIPYYLGWNGSNNFRLSSCTFDSLAQAEYDAQTHNERVVVKST